MAEDRRNHTRTILTGDGDLSTAEKSLKVTRGTFIRDVLLGMAAGGVMKDSATGGISPKEAVTYASVLWDVYLEECYGEAANRAVKGKAR